MLSTASDSTLKWVPTVSGSLTVASGRDSSPEVVATVSVFLTVGFQKVSGAIPFRQTHVIDLNRTFSRRRNAEP